jgi:hypothetical protein
MPGHHELTSCHTLITAWAQIRSHLAAFCAQPAIMTGGRRQWRA